MVTKDNSRRTLEGHIEDIEAKIAQADRKVSEAEGELQAYYREALVKLKEVKQVANARLEKLQDSSEEAWEDLKGDVDEAVERLRSNLDALMARVRDEPVRKSHVRREQDRGTGGKSKGVSDTRVKSVSKTKPKGASGRRNSGKRR